MINILELKVILESILEKPTDRRIEEVTKYVEFLEESEVDYLEWFKKHTDKGNIQIYNPLEKDEKIFKDLFLNITLSFKEHEISKGESFITMPTYFIFGGVGFINHFNKTLNHFLQGRFIKHPIPDSTCYRGLIGNETLIFHLPHLDSREKCEDNIEATGLPKMSYTGFIVPCPLEKHGPPYSNDLKGVKWLKYALSKKPDPKYCGLLYV